MKSKLIVALFAFTAMLDAFAGSISLSNNSNTPFTLGYTIKNGDVERNGTIHSIPHQTPGITFRDNTATYKVHTLYNSEDLSPVKCGELELNKYYTTIKITLNQDGSCVSELGS